MKKISLLIYLIALSVTLHAQKLQISAIKVGEKMPDVFISNIRNYPPTTVHLADFKGKLVILDFWGVSCASCIEEMPRMEALQREYGDKIQVLLVTQDSKEKVNALLKRSAFVRNVHLPFVIADTLLSKYFPSNAFGLHIWIDGNGKVVQRTSGENYTSRDVAAFLENQKVDIVQRQDFLTKSASAASASAFSSRKTGYDDKIKYFSCISGKNTAIAYGGSGGVTIDSISHKELGLNFINTPLLNLYRIAFEHNNVFAKKIIYEVSDPSIFNIPKVKYGDAYARWSEKNTYCYESKVPLSDADSLYTFMQQDLARCFNITGKIENRNVKCLLLVKTSDAASFWNHSDKHISIIDDDDAYMRDSIITGPGFHATNLIRFLQRYVGENSPIIDETNFKGEVRISIHASYDISALRKELQKNGFDLIEGERELKCLVLHENGYKESLNK